MLTTLLDQKQKLLKKQVNFSLIILSPHLKQYVGFKNSPDFFFDKKMFCASNWR